MALVREWITGFLSRHKARFDPHDWPDAGTEEWREYLLAWLTAMATNQITEAEADAASIALADCPPNFRREHIPAIIAKARSMRPAAEANANSREAAESASRNCPHCSGSGLVTIEHPHPDPARKVPRTVAAHCVCQMGRWVRSRLAATDEHTLKRIPDLADVLAGRTGWRYDDPTKCREPGAETAPAAADVRRGLNDVFKPARAG